MVGRKLEFKLATRLVENDKRTAKNQTYFQMKTLWPVLKENCGKALIEHLKVNCSPEKRTKNMTCSSI